MNSGRVDAVQSALPPRHYAELAAVIGTICAFSFCIGFVFPVIALALEARGFDEAAIGLNASAGGAGVFFGGLMMPRLVHRFGTFTMLAVGVCMAVVILMIFPLIDDYWVWVLLRFLLGASVTALFSLGEAWINAIAGEAHRGRTMAVYTAAMAGSFAVGSFVVSLVGYEGMAPFILAAVLILAFFAPVLRFRHRDPLEDADSLEGHGDILMIVLKQAAILMIVVALFGILDGVALGLLPSYSLAVGVPESLGSVPLGAMAFGVLLFQLPLGFLSDRMRRETLLSLVMFSVVGLAVLMPYVDLTHWSGLVFMALFGGLSFSPYTLALTMLGDRFKGRKLAAGSALFAVMWGTGATLGPFAFGFAMEEWGIRSLPYGLALLFLLTGAVSLRDRTGR